MNLKEELCVNVHISTILFLSRIAIDDEVKKELLLLGADQDDRVGYNALWTLTHVGHDGRQWLIQHRDYLIDILQSTSHVGRKRLLLNLLARMPWGKNDVRPQFLDFCFSRINSTEPYAIRAFALKLAFSQARHYQELLYELQQHMEVMTMKSLPPGLKCAHKNIVKAISKIK